MILTFAQYHTLIATGASATCEEVTSRTEFDSMMVRYSIATLLNHGLIKAIGQQHDGKTYYQLTEFGATCVVDYEIQNPGLKITSVFNAKGANA